METLFPTSGSLDNISSRKIFSNKNSLIMLLNKLGRGSVAVVLTTMFLGVSHAGDSIPACPTEFIKAWNAWDPTDPAKMPPLPENRVC